VALTAIPGLIDAHVHMREPGAEHKEDFDTGTAAALAGGYTTIIDMPNNPGAPTISAAALKDKIDRARVRIRCDIGFHFGGTPASVGDFDAVQSDVFGLKVYLDTTTGDLLVNRLDQTRMVFDAWPPSRPLLVHAEDTTVAAVLGLIAVRPRRIHFCHISLAAEICEIRAAKERGLPVTCEVTPHHLFLSEEDGASLGSYGVMKPPLRSRADVDALWRNMDVIDMVSTDHAPHTGAEKQAVPAPYGVPGLETALPLMLEAVAADRLSLERVVDLMSEAPARIFDVPLDAGAEVEIDMKQSWQIDRRNLRTKCGWTPFDGMRVRGRVRRVRLRGRLALEGDEVLAAPGSGHIVGPLV
jgi:dihydroorotase